MIYQWVAYGLDMFGYIIVETHGETIGESHRKAVTLLKDNGVEFDTVELFAHDFIERAGWLKN